MNSTPGKEWTFTLEPLGKRITEGSELGGGANTTLGSEMGAQIWRLELVVME